MRVLVCGGRDFNDKDLLSQHLTELYMRNPDPIKDGKVDFSIIEGEATGADTLAREWAEARSLPVHKYPANWAFYGKRAGYIRNRSMLDDGKPDIVIAFWDGKSRGTEMMIALAQSEDINTIVVDY